MAKDPAFLFYPGDWLGGTMLLTRHQKGCYIDLLMAQFNSGPLSLEQIKTVLGQDQAVWTVLQEKFIKNADGKLYNEKLATEIEKRKKYCLSKSNPNSGRKKSHDKSYDYFMNNHTENENVIENKIDKEGGMGETFIVPEIVNVWYQEFPNYTKSKGADLLAAGNMLHFITEQHGCGIVEKEKILSEVRRIAEQVRTDPFWVNKPLKSIANNLQEFYNKIKNGNNSTSAKVLPIEQYAGF